MSGIWILDIQKKKWFPWVNVVQIEFIFENRFKIPILVQTYRINISETLDHRLQMVKEIIVYYMFFVYYILFRSRVRGAPNDFIKGF